MLGWVQNVPQQMDTLVLKIQMKICKDRRKVKKEARLVLVFLLLPIFT